MNEPRKTSSTRNQDSKTLLSTLKMTTTIGAVSLTLAGWGLLSRVEANNLAQASPDHLSRIDQRRTGLACPGDGGFSSGITQTASILPATVVVSATATATPTQLPAALVLSTATAIPTPQPTATDTPAPSPTPLFKLDVAQWLQNSAGDPVAVVRDNQGTLWYVMGSDVPRIENGQSPQYQPQLVNGGGRTRRS